MNPSTDLLKKLQVQFLKVAARWVNYGIEVEPASVSLPNLVCLLQSVGYAIRRTDSVSPDDVPPLRNNQKGTQIVITCGHSGQRCILELPEEADQCNCIIKNNERDCFWEVTATNPTSKNSSLIETGSDTVPAVSKELNTILKHILMCLTHMIQGTLKDVEPEEGKSATNSNTSSPMKGAKRLSGFLQDFVNLPIIISSPKASDSSARYRSLDALTDSQNEGLPTPRLLTPKIPRTKECMVTKSSPSLNLFRNNEVASSSGSTTENQENDTVIGLLRKAISLLEVTRSQEVLSPKEASNTDVEIKETTFTKGSAKGLNSVRPKSASSPSLTINKKIKSSSASRLPINQSSTPVGTEKPGKPGSAKLPLKFSKLGIKSKSPKVSEENKNICSKPKKVSNLYSHIKSTIPKASPSGSFVSKKS